MLKKILTTTLILGIGLTSLSAIRADASQPISNETLKVEKNVTTFNSKSVNQNTHYEGSFQWKNKAIDYYSTGTYGISSTIGLYFTVPVSANYSLAETASGSPFEGKYCGLEKQLYKVENNTLTLVADRPQYLVAASTNHQYTAEPLNVYLDSNTQYLLVYNNSGHTIPGMNSLYIRTRLQRN